MPSGQDLEVLGKNYNFPIMGINLTPLQIYMIFKFDFGPINQEMENFFNFFVFSLFCYISPVCKDLNSLYPCKVLKIWNLQWHPHSITHYNDDYDNEMPVS